MTTLLLVRHGESEANRRDLFAGFYDAQLESHGEMQASVTARYIADNYDVDAVYASDLKRAYKTGQIIAEQLQVPIFAEQGLREINGGAWEGLEFHKLSSLYPREFGVWQSDLGSAGCPGGETVQALAERIMAALERIARENPDRTIVIATHATPIRVAMTMVKYGTLQRMKDVDWVSNASVTRITYDHGVWHCVEAGADRHLEGMVTKFDSTI